MKKILIGLMTSAISLGAMATTVGISNHPMVMKKHAVSTEFNNYNNAGSGMGLTARYYRQLSDRVNVDAGFGFTNGDRASRFNLGADIEIIPDYGRQPKFSLKGLAETENIDEERVNSFGFAPTLSKGIAIRGKELFPFIALPMKVSLNADSSEYETSTALALGATGRIPLAGVKNLIGNIETNISLTKSYS